MNKDKWNSLPKDLKEAFEAVADAAVKKASTIWQKRDDETIELAKARGHKFIYLTENEYKNWEEIIRNLKDEYVKELNARGLPGERIVQTANNLAKKNNTTYGKVKY